MMPEVASLVAGDRGFAVDLGAFRDSYVRRALAIALAGVLVFAAPAASLGRRRGFSVGGAVDCRPLATTYR
jgi:hypothetical protein